MLSPSPISSARPITTDDEMVANIIGVLTFVSVVVTVSHGFSTLAPSQRRQKIFDSALLQKETFTDDIDLTSNINVEVYDNVFSPSACEQIHELAVDHSIRGNDGSSIFFRPPHNESALTPLESIIHSALTNLNDTSRTVEYWSREEYMNIDTHADIDEVELEDDRTLRCPEVAHVLYLKVDEEVRGPTCVFPGKRIGWCHENNRRTKTVDVFTVPAVQGRVLRFPGSAMHGVPRPAHRWLLTKEEENTLRVHEQEEAFDDIPDDDDIQEDYDYFDEEDERSVLLFNTWSDKGSPPRGINRDYAPGTMPDGIALDVDTDFLASQERERLSEWERDYGIDAERISCNPRSDWIESVANTNRDDDEKAEGEEIRLADFGSSNSHTTAAGQKHRPAEDRSVKTEEQPTTLSLLGGLTESHKKAMVGKRSHAVQCCSLVLLAVFVSLLVGETVGAAPFGTEAGYDVEGGTEPLCFNSLYPNASKAFEMSDVPVKMDNAFDDLNSALYTDDADEKGTSLRTRCYNGTRLWISLVNAPNGTLFTDTTYTYRIRVQIDPSVIGVNSTIAASNATCWIRLLLCDVVEAGFCSPLYDTIETELLLDSSDTEDTKGSGEIESSSSEDDTSGRYDYSRNVTLIGVTQEKHIFSRYVRWRLREAEDGSGKLEAIVDIDFKIPLGLAGVYFFIGHAIVFLTTADDLDALIRVDVANAVPNNVVSFIDPPNVLELTTPFRITMSVAIGIAVVSEVGLFVFIIYHRKHQVMRLAQAPFLATFMACAIFTTCSCILLLWTTDVTCALFGPFMLVPLTMMAAILVGRLWRAYSMLSTALTLGKKSGSKETGERLVQFLSFLADWRLSRCCRCLKQKSSSTQRRRTTRASLRTVVKDGDLWRLIVILTLPQLILQILSSTLVTRNVEIQYDAEERVGRQTCGADEWWLPLLGVVYIGVMFLFVITIAWMSRDLPSVLNEKSAIFKAGTVCGIISFLGVALLVITDDPSTSPNVTVFLWYAIVLSVVGALSWYIVMPKVRRVRSGEKIVVSSLLAPSHGRKFSYDLTSNTNYTSKVNFKQTADSDVPGKSAVAEHNPAVSSLSFDGDHVEGHEEAAPTQANNGSNRSDAIVLRRDDPPPRTIETQIFKTSELISEFNSMTFEGRHIPQKEWKELQESIALLHGDLDRLEFSWIEEESDDTLA